MVEAGGVALVRCLPDLQDGGVPWRLARMRQWRCLFCGELFPYGRISLAIEAGAVRCHLRPAVPGRPFVDRWRGLFASAV
ncbi:hypothetical protein ASF01_01945 [Stenotrophomonas sp. Leaf70]|uniref:Uncharacterized protein n=1 Tax=Stenotrophomonas nitritireducens TaxID=83617 RepID=A0ABR5NKH0_9GAMM|nr:hypothetical protein ASF01_01945 [Stenotrophomonas sp. Leaf70]KRG57719.1 hypothetical protein ABB22_08545 [Stenotrophomonas nitritireducens]